MLVTESLFSMNSDTPDIVALQDLAHEFGATLLVDVAHDLGCLGPDGTGHIGLQGMLGKVDLVMGSFSKTFGSNGGFVCTNSREVKEYLRFYSPSCTFSNALSPVQVAVVDKALQIVSLGRRSRTAPQTDAQRAFAARSYPLARHGSLRRPIRHRRRQDRRRGPGPDGCRELPDLGLIANLVEFPAVAKGEARFRLQVMATHGGEQIAAAADRMAAAVTIARRRLEAGFDEVDLPLAMAG